MLKKMSCYEQKSKQKHVTRLFYHKLICEKSKQTNKKKLLKGISHLSMFLSLASHNFMSKQVSAVHDKTDSGVDGSVMHRGFPLLPFDTPSKIISCVWPFALPEGVFT